MPIIQPPVKPKETLYEVAVRLAKNKNLSGAAADDFIMDYQFTHCSGCGGEIDGDGNCPQYCSEA